MLRTTVGEGSGAKAGTQEAMAIIQARSDGMGEREESGMTPGVWARATARTELPSREAEGLAGVHRSGVGLLQATFEPALRHPHRAAGKQVEM